MTSLGPGGVEDLPVNYALNDVIEVMPDDSVNSFSPSTPLTSLGPSLGGRHVGGERERMYLGVWPKVCG